MSLAHYSVEFRPNSACSCRGNEAPNLVSAFQSPCKHIHGRNSQTHHPPFPSLPMERPHEPMGPWSPMGPMGALGPLLEAFEPPKGPGKQFRAFLEIPVPSRPGTDPQPASWRPRGPREASGN